MEVDHRRGMISGRQPLDHVVFSLIIQYADDQRSEMGNSRRYGALALDERDTRLIALLERNARAPLAELARALSVSPQSVSDRLKRLEDLGVLAGFTLSLDPKKLGLAMGAYIRIQPAMGELARVAEIVRDIPEIVECDRITGEDCFTAKLFVATVEDLEAVIDRLIPYARTNTSIIQSSPVPRRLPRYA
jgi:Lrp/AsnC family leucine-responsive transcriptional regulator